MGERRGKVEAYGRWWGTVRDGLADFLKLSEQGIKVDAIESMPKLSPLETVFVNAAFRVIDGSGGFSYVELEAMLRLTGVRTALHPRYARMIGVFSRAASAAISEQRDRRMKESRNDHPAGRH